MKEIINIDIDQSDKLFEIGRALGSEIRIKILIALRQSSLNVNEIAEKINIPVSTAASNIKVLEDVGLIITNYQPGARGAMKLCARKIDEVAINLGLNEFKTDRNTIIQSVPIGAYTDCWVEQTCGLADENDHILENEPSNFFLPQRLNAQILWFGNGYVEYKFSKGSTLGKKIKNIKLSAELCSEAPKYRMDWPSDITVWFNNMEIGTWTSPGDFGGRRGKNNPEWWPDYNTQYGTLKSWVVTDEGGFIDEKLASNTKISDIPDLNLEYLVVKIGIKKNAINIGGINIFGEKFGDYQQNIELIINYY